MSLVGNVARASTPTAASRGVGISDIRLLNTVRGLKVQAHLTHRNMKSPTALTLSAAVGTEPTKKAGKLTVRVGTTSVEVKVPKGSLLKPNDIAGQLSEELRSKGEGKYLIEYRPAAATTANGGQSKAEIVIFEKAKTTPARPPAVDLYEKNLATVRALSRPPTFAADAARINITPAGLAGVTRHLIVSNGKVYLQTSGMMGPGGFGSRFSEVGPLI